MSCDSSNGGDDSRGTHIRDLFDSNYLISNKDHGLIKKESTYITSKAQTFRAITLVRLLFSTNVLLAVTL